MDDSDKTTLVNPSGPRGHGRRALPQLIVIEGISRGRFLELSKPMISIGRREDNDLILASGSVSKKHCQVYCDGEHFLIEDLQSTNGVLVNGARLAPGESRMLCHGDTIAISDHQLLFLHENDLSSADGASSISLDSARIRAEVDALFQEFPGAAR